MISAAMARLVSVVVHSGRPLARVGHTVVVVPPLYPIEWMAVRPNRRRAM